jgi:glucosylceramidase
MFKAVTDCFHIDIKVHKCQGRYMIEWVATTQTSQWQTKVQLTISPALGSNWDVEAQVDKPLQTIDGFGACFNELGWTSLSALASADRESILQELFAPGVGANFNTCRMPVGANDFSLDWYSVRRGARRLHRA